MLSKLHLLYFPRTSETGFFWVLIGFGLVFLGCSLFYALPFGGPASLGLGAVFSALGLSFITFSR